MAGCKSVMEHYITGAGPPTWLETMRPDRPRLTLNRTPRIILTNAQASDTRRQIPPTPEAQKTLAGTHYPRAR